MEDSIRQHGAYEEQRRIERALEAELPGEATLRRRRIVMGSKKARERLFYLERTDEQKDQPSEAKGQTAPTVHKTAQTASASANLQTTQNSVARRGR
jgi:hypothetical protein